jgi:hypothetical protein
MFYTANIFNVFNISTLFLLLNLYQVDSQGIQETILKEHLFENYNSDVLPTNNLPVNLKLGIAFRSFNKIDQVEGTIDANIWLRYFWKDDFLKWNPNEWGNITSIVVNTHSDFSRYIWTPDIYLYNTAEMPLSNLDYSRAMLESSGSIIWSRPGIIKSTCVFDVRNFPYDTQYCYFKFGSWSYHGLQLNLTEYDVSIDISNLQRNEEWTLDNYISNLEVKKYSCCSELYPSVIYNLTLTRKAGYYKLNIIIPTFATATLMIISMIIPWDSGERISFATTVMLSIIVFLLILSDSLPKTDTEPLLSRMLVGLMFFSLIIVFFTVIITAIRKINKKSKVGNFFLKICKKYNICKSECNDENSMEDTEFENVINTVLYNDNSINTRSLSYLNSIHDIPNNQFIRQRNNQITPDIPTNTNSNEQSSNDKIEEECNQIANYLEICFTFFFFISFIIYCLVVLN